MSEGFCHSFERRGPRSVSRNRELCNPLHQFQFFNIRYGLLVFMTLNAGFPPSPSHSGLNRFCLDRKLLRCVPDRMPSTAFCTRSSFIRIVTGFFLGPCHHELVVPQDYWWFITRQISLIAIHTVVCPP